MLCHVALERTLSMQCTEPSSRYSHHECHYSHVVARVDNKEKRVSNGGGGGGGVDTLFSLLYYELLVEGDHTKQIQSNSRITYKHTVLTVHHCVSCKSQLSKTLGWREYTADEN